MLFYWISYNKIFNELIRKKMGEIKNRPNQEKVVYGPNITPPGYAKPQQNNR